MSDHILVDVQGGLARVTLNRPQQLNAVGSVAARRWREIAEDLTARDDVEAIILDAAGPAFCAGGDVMEMAAGGPDGDLDGRLVTELADEIHAGHYAFQRGAKPIVAAVQGAVAGGGLGFMLVADYVVAADRATFQSKYADIGLTPDCGVSTLLPEAVGIRRALRLSLTDLRLDAATAQEWELVQEVVLADEVAARAEEIARGWMSGASAAFGHARRLIRAMPGRDYRDGLDDEARTIGAAIETSEAQARIAAFAARSSTRG